MGVPNMGVIRLYECICRLLPEALAIGVPTVSWPQRPMGSRTALAAYALMAAPGEP